MKYVLFLSLTTLFLIQTKLASAQRWVALFDSTQILMAKGDFKAAMALNNLTLEQAKKEFGENAANYGKTLMHRAGLYQRSADYYLAEQTLIRAASLIEPDEKARKEYYAVIMAMFSAIYRSTSQYDKAVSFANKSVQIAEKENGRANDLYAGALMNLGVIYLQKGDYPKAIEIINNVLAIRSSLFPHTHDKYLETINNLGLTYSGMGDLIKAEPLLEEAARLRKQTLGENHPRYWYSLNNLSVVVHRMGDIHHAIALDREVVERAGSIQPGSEVHLSSLNSLINEYVALKQYERADSVAQVGLAVLEKKGGKASRFYGMILYNKARAFEQRDQFQQAERLYLQAIDNYKTVTAENSTLINTLKALAIHYSKTGQYNRADSLFTQCDSLIKAVFGLKSSAYTEVLFDKARHSLLRQKPDQALPLIQTADSLLHQQFQQLFPYWSATQRQNYTQQWSNDLAIHSTIINQAASKSAIRQLFYNRILFQKNLLLSEQLRFGQTLKSLNDTTLVKKYDAISSLRSQLARNISVPTAQRKNLDSLETKAETLEKELARQSAPFRQAQKELQVRWEDIRNALKPHEAAVEFVSYPYHNGRQQTDTIRYLALVLRPHDTSPQLVPLLYDEAPLRQLLARRKGATLYATRGSEIDTDQLSQGDSLFRLIWHPIDHLLTNTKTVYVSPSGLLHQVSFGALPYPTTAHKAPQYLIDRYQLKQVSSTRQIATPSTDVTYQSIGSAQLYGGIQYDSTSTGSDTWPFLPGAKREVEQIGTFIGTKATVLADSNASERRFKDISGQSPTVLHLATHGFSFPDPAVSTNDTSAKGNTFRRIANPLFRTGLLMAGANQAWQGQRVALGQEDGILTAYEVSNLNLSNTKLVVLSACETALGDIRGSEGVFGLQRAFKMAGVQYLLMSLWPVPDEATSTLMTQFYKNWKKHKTIRQAFQQTQQQMRKQYPPTVWAAFILVE